MSLSSALRTRDLAELPSRRDEAWRWSDLRGLIRQLPPSSPNAGDVGGNPLLKSLSAAKIVYVNGRLIQGDQIAIPETGKGAFLRRFVSATDGSGHALENTVEVGAGARLLLIDSFEGRAADYVSSVAGFIRLGAGSSVERLVILDDTAEAISVATFEIELAQGASYSQTVLASGAKRQRFESHVRLSGSTTLRLDGLYLLGGGRHSDQTTTVTHSGLGGFSNQLVKGVVADRSRGVFQGQIVVSEGADGTNARLGHHGVLLTDHAEIDSKPELEIYADDVQCAHGNTIGALDDVALFYARARGIPEDQARIMLTAAFVGEVVDRCSDESVREIAQAYVEAHLRGLL